MPSTICLSSSLKEVESPLNFTNHKGDWRPYANGIRGATKSKCPSNSMTPWNRLYIPIISTPNKLIDPRY